MTKNELIDAFEANNWYFNDNNIYRSKLLKLSYGELVEKLRDLGNKQAITVFK